MFFTDTHTHLYLEQFEDDIETVINDAINVGVNKFFLPAISSNLLKSVGQFAQHCRVLNSIR